MRTHIILGPIALAFSLMLIPGLIVAPSANGLQQVAGKVEFMMAPGETKTYRWGLISDIDEEAELGFSVTGNGAEFVSLPKTVDIGPRQSVYVFLNVTIPSEHPGNVTLKPVAYATQFGKPGGPTVINIQMQKTLTIAIKENPDARFKTLEAKSFVQQVRLGDSDIAFAIQSSSQISDFALDEQRKQISFTASGLAGTNGSAVIPVGKVLEGPYNVMIDGQPISDFETIRDEASPETSIRINYSHSVRTITVTGTNVVPEFSLPIIGLVALSIGSMLVLAKKRFPSG